MVGTSNLGSWNGHWCLWLERSWIQAWRIQDEYISEGHILMQFFRILMPRKALVQQGLWHFIGFWICPWFTPMISHSPRPDKISGWDFSKNRWKIQRINPLAQVDGFTNTYQEESPAEVLRVFGSQPPGVLVKMGKWIVWRSFRGDIPDIIYIYILLDKYIYIICIYIYIYYLLLYTNIGREEQLASQVHINVSPNIGYKWIWRDIKPTNTGNLARNNCINMWYS